MKKPMRKNPAKPYRNETALQTMVCNYIKLQYPDVPFYAVPNGGKMSKVMGGIRKATGTVAGIPDLCIAAPSMFHAALYIELKNGTSNDLTPDQAYQIGRLNAAGNKAIVCRTFEEAKEAIDNHLNQREGL